MNEQDTTELCLPLVEDNADYQAHLELERQRHAAEFFLQEREQDLAMMGWY